MNIVMVHDCSHVGYELRKELVKMGVNVEQVFFSASRLPKVATMSMVVKLRKMKSDLIHAHYCRSPAYAAFFSGKPYLLHCHGSDVRDGVSWIQRRCLKKAKRVLVSTPDLIEILPNATWLPNPVDTKRFKPLGKHEGNKVLYFPRWYEEMDSRLKEICEKRGFDLTIPRGSPVPYEKMHLFLNEFDIFVDQLSIRSYSKTALEAMACGLAVIGYWQGLEMLENLYSQGERQKLIEWQKTNVLRHHEAENVAKQLVEIYSEVI